MLGMPTKLVILSRVQKVFAGSGDPTLGNIAAVMAAQPAYANFGALGPAIGDFMPVQDRSGGVLGHPGTNPYVALWKLIFNVFEGDGTTDNPGLKPTLDGIRDLLNKVDAVAAAEDLNGLKALEGQLGKIHDILSALGAIVVKIKGDGTLSNLGILPDVQKLISQGNMPAIVRPLPGGGIGFPAQFWSLRDFLSWRRTGRFAKALLNAAQNSNDQRFLAYAYGWIVSWGASTGGAAAIASIIGAPFRNQWWRARWTANYVDAWAFGQDATGATFDGTNWNPGYDAWPSLCDAELQTRLMPDGSSLDPDAVMKALATPGGLGSPLPTDLGDFWVNAYNATYKDLAPQLPAVQRDDVLDAHAMAWLVLWFQTSAQSLGCAITAPAMPGGNCGDTPAWTDPTKPGDNGSGSGPQQPEVDKQVSVPNVVCAIALSLLAIISFCTGGFLAGVGFTAAAIAEWASIGTIDWDKFRCGLAWDHLYLYNGLKGLHTLMTLGAIVYPYAPDLKNKSDSLASLIPSLPLPFDSGEKLVVSKTQSADFQHPHQPWDGSNISWIFYPSNPIEEPATIAALSSAFPNGFIDDPGNPFGTDDLVHAGGWPVGPLDANGMPIGFRNAVDNLKNLFLNLNADFPDWNLDGDRGVNYHTWVLKGGYASPVPLSPEP